MTSREYEQVERPFVEQLQALGWDYLPGDTGVPYLTEQETLRQVPLVDRLRAVLRWITVDEAGEPWLDAARLGTPRLVEANREATRLLNQGTHVEGPGGGKPVPVRYLDFERPKHNDDLGVNQFRVDPPWATSCPTGCFSSTASPWPSSRPSRSICWTR